MKTYRCPHCLTKFPYSEVWFQCLEPRKKSRTAHKKYRDKVEAVILGTAKRFPRNFTNWYAKLPLIDSTFYEDDEGNDIRNQYYSSIVDKHIFKASKKTVGRKYSENSIPATAKCPYCNGKHRVFTHVCPNPECNKEIRIDEYEHQYIINIAGTSANGKSLFLGALLYSIDRYLPHITSWNITLDENAQRYITAYIRYMLYGVNTNKTDIDPYNRVASVSFKNGDQEKYTFIFYDTHGELFNVTDDAQLFQSAKYFLDPDFIIMACDPSNFEEVRRAVFDSKVIDESIKKSFVDNCPLPIQTGNCEITNTDVDNLNPDNLTSIDTLFEVETPYADIPTPTQVVSRIVSFLKVLDAVNLGYRGKRHTIPFALCLTKSDLIKELYADNEEISYILEPSTLTSSNLSELSYKKFAADYKRKSFAFKDALKDTWFEKSLVGVVDSSFLNSYFCAVSSKGYNTDKITRADQITPTGVLDPFVWFLSSLIPDIFPEDDDTNDLEV